MGRKKQNPAESKKRLLILKAANKMFMKQGYSTVSMDALAASVPVSKRTLYNHFQDKEALFSAVMHARCKQLFITLDKAKLSSREAETTLTRVAKEFMDLAFSQDAVSIYRTAITESRHFPALGKLFFESGPKRATLILAEYFKRLHEQNIMHIPDPILAANIFLSMLTNRVHMKFLLGLKKEISQADKNRIVRYVVRLFINGQRPERANA